MQAPAKKLWVMCHFQLVTMAAFLIFSFSNKDVQFLRATRNASSRVSKVKSYTQVALHLRNLELSFLSGQQNFVAAGL